MCIEYNGQLYYIVKFLHVKPGKGPAFVRTTLKNVKTGKVIDNTFNSGVKINEARVEHRQYQYTYKDAQGYHLMNTETYEEIVMGDDQIPNADLMKEGENIEVVVHAETETVLTAELPPFMTFEITYTEPGVRGDTSSTSSLKPATIETGANIMVPLFVNQGDKIKVDTRDRSYVERVK